MRRRHGRRNPSHAGFAVGSGLRVTRGPGRIGRQSPVVCRAVLRLWAPALAVGARSGVGQIAVLHEGLGMHTFPADERRISEVERGRSCEAVVPLPAGAPLLAGEAVLFALAESRAGHPPCYVKGGDSVLVSLTGVTDLAATDPLTGQAFVRLVWAPLGQGPAPAAPEPGVKPRRSRRLI